MNELGKRLRAQRAALGLKQDELAARLFVTRQTISNYERGLSEPDLDMLRRLAEALETEPAVLLGSETAARKGSGKKELLSFLLGLVLTAGVAALFIALEKQAFAWKGTHYDIVPYERVVLLLMPLIFLLLGWTLAQGADCDRPLSDGTGAHAAAPAAGRAVPFGCGVSFFPGCAFRDRLGKASGASVRSGAAPEP